MGGPSVIGRRRRRKPSSRYVVHHARFFLGRFSSRRSMCASRANAFSKYSGSGILSKPRGRRSAAAQRGLQDATPICSVRRDAGSVSSPNRAAPRRRFFFFVSIGFLRTASYTLSARMFVSRCNFYACHTKGWASEPRTPDGRDPFALRHFVFARPSWHAALRGAKSRAALRLFPRRMKFGNG